MAFYTDSCARAADTSIGLAYHSWRAAGLRPSRSTPTACSLKVMMLLSRLATQCPDGFGHALRVSRMAVWLAANVGVRGRDLEDIRLGGLLHDVGKTAIPAVILHKAGPLSAWEWACMSTHPQHSYELLRSHGLRRAAIVAHCHHERWDGSGYPLGLKGVQIPLGARCVALADCCDALLSERPYRSAQPVEVVAEQLRRGAGRYFEPRLAGLVLKAHSRQETGRALTIAPNTEATL